MTLAPMLALGHGLFISDGLVHRAADPWTEAPFDAQRACNRQTGEDRRKSQRKKCACRDTCGYTDVKKKIPMVLKGISPKTFQCTLPGRLFLFFVVLKRTIRLNHKKFKKIYKNHAARAVLELDLTMLFG